MKVTAVTDSGYKGESNGQFLLGPMPLFLDLLNSCFQMIFILLSSGCTKLRRNPWTLCCSVLKIMLLILEILFSGLAIKVCIYDESDHLPVHTEDKIFYTEDDYRNFLERRGWTSLREFEGYRTIDSMDDLRPGAIYRGVSWDHYQYDV